MPVPAGSKERGLRTVGAGERWKSGACKHCFQYLILVYQLLVYPVIGLHFTQESNKHVEHVKPSMAKLHFLGGIPPKSEH